MGGAGASPDTSPPGEREEEDEGSSIVDGVPGVRGQPRAPPPVACRAGEADAARSGETPLGELRFASAPIALVSARSTDDKRSSRSSPILGSDPTAGESAGSC